MLYILVKREKSSYYLLIDPAGKIEDICSVLGRLTGDSPEDIQIFIDGQPADADWGVFDLAIDEYSNITYKIKKIISHDAEMKPVYEYV